MTEKAEKKSVRDQSAGHKRGQRESASKEPAEPFGENLLLLQQRAGNRAVSQLMQRFNASSSVNQTPDARIATRTPAAELSTRALDHAPPFQVQAEQITPALGTGHALPMATQQQLAAKFNQDFSGVRVHDNASADYLAKSLGAKAFTLGDHIVFRNDRYSPTSRGGSDLLMHEGGHVAANRLNPQTASSQTVQLSDERIDDVTEEMVGLPFTMRTAAGTGANQIPKGTTVVIVDWNKLGPTAKVEATLKVADKETKVTLDVPKLVLEPAVPTASGVRRYKVGLGAQQQAVEKAVKGTEKQRADIAAWKAKESSYKTKHDAWQKQADDLQNELVRQEDLLAKKEETLSRMLVRETMYNQFDPVIKKWVDHYNTLLKPKTKLDPNLVKSVMFRETRMGTFGEHLELPPYSWADPKKNPIRSRFNVMQAIDSYSDEQMLMIEEMAPPIFTKYKLGDLKTLTRSKSMSQAEMWSWNSNALANAVQEYHKVDPRTNKNLNETVGKELYTDYSYWIRTGVRALFWKYSITRDWPEAARAHKGRPDPKKAPKEHQATMAYKKDVMSRVGGTSDVDVGNK